MENGMSKPNTETLKMAEVRMAAINAGFQYDYAFADSSAISYVLDALNYYREKAALSELEINRRDQRPHGIDNAF